MIAVAVIAAVTVVLSTMFVCAAISSTRQSTPCLFNGSIVFTRVGRYDGGKCTGKADNVYVSATGATQKLHGTRSCNGHLSHLMDVADQLVRESK